MAYGYREDGYFFLKIMDAFPGVPDVTGWTIFFGAPLGHARHRQGSCWFPHVSGGSILLGLWASGESADSGRFCEDALVMRRSTVRIRSSAPGFRASRTSGLCAGRQPDDCHAPKQDRRPIEALDFEWSSRLQYECRLMRYIRWVPP
jgi:hypothetical protein